MQIFTGTTYQNVFLNHLKTGFGKDIFGYHKREEEEEE